MCLATLLGVASCGRDVTGPRGVRAGAVQLNPAFPMVRLEGQGQPLSVASIVSFTRVRIILLRANGDTVINRVVEFPPESASLSAIRRTVASETPRTRAACFTVTQPWTLDRTDSLLFTLPVGYVLLEALLKVGR